MGYLNEDENEFMMKLLATALLTLLVSGYLKLGLIGFNLSAKQDNIKADWRITKIKVFIVLRAQ